MLEAFPTVYLKKNRAPRYIRRGHAQAVGTPKFGLPRIVDVHVRITDFIDQVSDLANQRQSRYSPPLVEAGLLD